MTLSKEIEDLIPLCKMALASKKGKQEVVHFFNEYPQFSVNQNLGFIEGRTPNPLDYAFRTGRISTVRFLLNKKACSSSLKFGKPLPQLLMMPPAHTPDYLNKIRFTLRNGDNASIYFETTQRTPIADIIGKTAGDPHFEKIGLNIIHILMEEHFDPRLFSREQKDYFYEMCNSKKQYEITKTVLNLVESKALKLNLNEHLSPSSFNKNKTRL